jgi:hypothetical protein
MYTNLTKFKVTINSETDHFHFELSTKRRDKNKGYPLYFYLSRPEVLFAIDCLKGISEFSPAFYDGIYFIRFVPSGITHYYVSDGSRTEATHIQFPGNVLACKIQNMLDLNELSYEMSKEFIDYSHKMVYPKMKLSFLDYDYNLPDDYNYLKGVIKRLSHDDYVKKDFTRYLHSLCNIAKNSSDGKLVTVNLQYDGYNESRQKYPSFYWYILTSDNQWVMDGGLIFHHDYKDGKYIPDQGKYSMHT